jgi:hypothetical protein
MMCVFQYEVLSKFCSKDGEGKECHIIGTEDYVLQSKYALFPT